MHNVDSSLKLSYSPLTVYEFDNFRMDDAIYNYLTPTSIYVIAKRALPIMRFIEKASDGIRISVRMGNADPLKLAILQKDNSNIFGEKGLSQIGTGSNIVNSSDEFHSMTLYKKCIDEDIPILTANLDRLIHLASNGKINLRIQGDITPYVSYDVLYIGQCVGEHILQRFKTHHALLEILIKENIIPPNYDKVNDLVILPFTVESDVVSVITGDSKKEEFIEAITGEFSFSYKEISLDCEKALVKAMTPKYNKTRFKQYPKSSDGLFNHDLNSYTYRICENIVLCYGDDKIYGDVKGIEASKLVVNKNQEFYILE